MIFKVPQSAIKAFEKIRLKIQKAVANQPTNVTLEQARQQIDAKRN